MTAKLYSAGGRTGRRRMPRVCSGAPSWQLARAALFTLAHSISAVHGVFTIKSARAAF